MLEGAAGSSGTAVESIYEEIFDTTNKAPNAASSSRTHPLNTTSSSKQTDIEEISLADSMHMMDVSSDDEQHSEFPPALPLWKDHKPKMKENSQDHIGDLLCISQELNTGCNSRHACAGSCSCILEETSSDGTDSLPDLKTSRRSARSADDINNSDQQMLPSGGNHQTAGESEVLFSLGGEPIHPDGVVYEDLSSFMSIPPTTVVPMRKMSQGSAVPVTNDFSVTSVEHVLPTSATVDEDAPPVPRRGPESLLLSSRVNTLDCSPLGAARFDARPSRSFSLPVINRSESPDSFSSQNGKLIVTFVI